MAKDKGALGVLLILLIPTQAVSEVQMGAMSSSVMSNPAYEVEEQSGQANPVHECGMKSAAELEDELGRRRSASMPSTRPRASPRSSRKAQAVHAAGAEKVQAAHAAELKKVAAELEQAVAELARLKKDE